ncbi:MAG: hypothetical protein NTU79_04460 [Planctomycetota bacterium]|nr:hypothetical protein [Planctomycetota bacterium]
MMYLLDTNVCIRFLQGRSDNLLKRFNSVSAQDKCICSIVAAAIAKANQLIVVTHNLSEFSRVPGLVCEDWES